MSHRKLLTLALTIAGALAMTAINTPASVAEDTGATETTQASSADQYENRLFAFEGVGVLGGVGRVVVV